MLANVRVFGRDRRQTSVDHDHKQDEEHRDLTECGHTRGRSAVPAHAIHTRELPPLPHADGVSLVPLIQAAGEAGDGPAGDGFTRPLFAHLDRRWGRPEEPSDPLVAVLAEQQRLILRVNQPEQSEFYDRSVDPAESHNLFSERLEEAQRFRELGERYMADAKAPWGRQPAEVELDELQMNQLRALGYVIR